MKKYGEYTSTDVTWLYEIPAHWKLYRAKRVFSNPKEKNEGNKENNVLSLTLKGVINNDIDNPIGLSPSDYSTYQIFEANDLVFKLIDLENISTSRVGLVHERGIMSSAYIRFQAREDVNIRYFYLYYYSMWLRHIFNGLGAGVRQTLSASDLLDIKIPVPPRPEQDQIVRFLDYKTAKIDKLISGYKRQIELLEERRQAVIDNAVTKGVRPNRKMQNIMGNWMGDIPTDWEMIPSKRLFIEGKARKYADDKPATASQKYGIILQEDYMRIENKRIVIATQGLDDWKHVNVNDFVISLRSFQGGIERSEIVGCVTWHYIVLLPQNNVEPRYFKWLLKSRHYIKALRGTSEFIRDGQDLRYSNFAQIPLPLITIEEQNEIADYIETEIAKIDGAIPVIEKQIALLQEYRTRLISDVVTGQVDVRDETISEIEVN